MTSTCDHTKFSTAWHECPIHPNSDCCVARCDNCNEQVASDCTVIPFNTWKAEYQPRIYEDSGAECYDHEECDCEFLYTFEHHEVEELKEEEGIKYNQVWTWRSDGSITAGVCGPELLITEKRWTDIFTEVK
jgi:hypothetical protein